MRTRLKDAVTEVWGGLRRPWQLTYVAWDETPGAIVGDGRPWAFLRGTETLRASDAGIEATVTLGSRTAAGGVCLGVKGPDDLVALEVRNDGRVRVRVKRRGVWTDVGGVTLPSSPAERPLRLHLRVGGSVLRLHIGMPFPDIPFSVAGLTPSDLDGSAGLMAESGEVRFESVDIRGR